MENLSFQYPGWFVLLCVLAGLAYALGLYFRDRSFREAAPRLNFWFGCLRFTAVTLLCLLLLTPLLKSIETQTRKPVVVVAQDDSESILQGMDSTTLRNYRGALEALIARLENDYEVHAYSFGEDVVPGLSFAFDDKTTDLAAVFRHVYDTYDNQNLGAVILASDGIFNRGSNPLYSGRQLNVPFYAIALGDTVPRKDLVLKRVFHNQIAYLGDRFVVQADMRALNCAGQSTTLKVTKVDGAGGEQVLLQESVPIPTDDFFQTRDIVLEADQSGVQRYRIQLSPLKGEASTVNNLREVFIDVLDARQRILLLANSPHPDLAALRFALEKNKNYEVEVAYIRTLKANLADYNFVVLHQLPSLTHDAAGVLQQIRRLKLPHLFVVGTQTHLQRFNTAQNLLTIQGDQRNTNDVFAAFAPVFNLFTLSEPLKKELPTFNPLTVPFGDFSESPSAQTLLYQRIGKVDTRYPLLTFGEQDGARVAVLAGEGLWRWRLFDYLQHQNHDLFEELIRKTFQYATLKADKRRFRIVLDKNIFNENEAVVFRAELYNESYELVNQPDVSLTITDAEGRDFAFTFDKTDNAYTLNAGIFPVGNYTFRGSVSYNGQNLTHEGRFSIQPIQLELFSTTADHGLLRLLAAQSGGRVFLPDEVDRLATLLEEQPLRPVVYSTTRTLAAIHLKWIFFLLLGLLSLEWFLRRYHGAY